ncbi:MAG: rhomboid family intramembrane serine protease [bacterium]|nr:rhomboid family intramembrane serine protease [bacterium]
MFLTPADYHFNWKQPPRLVLGIALVLGAVFLLWHPADRQRQEALREQYSQELLAIEWPLYETHMLKSGQRSTLDQLRAAKTAGNTALLADHMGSDEKFADGIRLNGKDYLQNDVFDKWQPARDRFDAEHKKLATEILGVDPEHFRPITLLTFNLVQPDTVQFAGVLLLLLTAGMAVEVALGSGAVLTGFLGGGIIGALAYLLVNGGGVLPLAGAGAAVAGVVGVFLMHFRAQPLKYFAAVQFTALLIPVLWLGFLLAQHFLAELRPAEFAAQIAGFATGLLLYPLHQRWFAHEAAIMVETPAETEADLDQSYREQLQLALDAIGRMEFAEAQKRLRELVKAYPQDLRVLVQLYHIEKLNPDSTTYDAVSRRLFLLSTHSETGARIALPVYRDYDKLSLEKRALDTEVCLKLVMRFARAGEVKDAEKIMKTVLARKASHALLAKAAHSLSQAFEELHDPSRAETYRELAKSPH